MEMHEAIRFSREEVYLRRNFSGVISYIDSILGDESSNVLLPTEDICVAPLQQELNMLHPPPSTSPQLPSLFVHLNVVQKICLLLIRADAYSGLENHSQSLKNAQEAIRLSYSQSDTAHFIAARELFFLLRLDESYEEFKLAIKWLNRHENSDNPDSFLTELVESGSRSSCFFWAQNGISPSQFLKNNENFHQDDSSYNEVNPCLPKSNIANVPQSQQPPLPKDLSIEPSVSLSYLTFSQSQQSDSSQKQNEINNHIKSLDRSNNIIPTEKLPSLEVSSPRSSHLISRSSSSSVLFRPIEWNPECAGWLELMDDVKALKHLHETHFIPKHLEAMAIKLLPQRIDPLAKRLVVFIRNNTKGSLQFENVYGTKSLECHWSCPNVIPPGNTAIIVFTILSVLTLKQIYVCYRLPALTPGFVFFLIECSILGALRCGMMFSLSNSYSSRFDINHTKRLAQKSRWNKEMIIPYPNQKISISTGTSRRENFFLMSISELLYVSSTPIDLLCILDLLDAENLKKCSMLSFWMRDIINALPPSKFISSPAVSNSLTAVSYPNYIFKGDRTLSPWTLHDPNTVIWYLQREEGHSNSFQRLAQTFDKVSASSFSTQHASKVNNNANTLINSLSQVQNTNNKTKCDGDIVNRNLACIEIWSVRASTDPNLLIISVDPENRENFIIYHGYTSVPLLRVFRRSYYIFLSQTEVTTASNSVVGTIRTHEVNGDVQFFFKDDLNPIYTLRSSEELSLNNRDTKLCYNGFYGDRHAIKVTQVRQTPSASYSEHTYAFEFAPCTGADSLLLVLLIFYRITQAFLKDLTSLTLA